jgi:Skp family chaperone for outer membrane proteins
MFQGVEASMTRKFIYLTLALALFCSMSAFAQAAAAAPAPTGASTKIGIINVEEAIVSSNEGQRDFAAMMSKYKAPNDQLQAMSKELEDKRSQLKNGSTVLSDEKRAELAGSIQDLEKNAQRFFDDNQAKVQKEQGEIANRIGQKMLKVIDVYAKNNGYGVILDVSAPQSPVLWANAQGGIVITKEIVDAYNAQSGVPPQPKPAGAAAGAGAAPRPGSTVTRPAGTTAPKPAGTTTTPK